MERRDEYKQALEAVRAELSDLLTEQAEIERRIIQLKRTARSLARLCEEETIHKKDLPNYKPEIEEYGITNLVREVLKNSKGALTPVEIKEGLNRLGYDISLHTNIMASIHAILKRLIKQDEVRAFTKSGKKFYKWEVVAKLPFKEPG